jgi:hypothetical protein
MHPADHGQAGSPAESIGRAANDEFGPTGRALEPSSGVHPGWDPLEVWQTRVRDPRRAATEPERR